jgi:hypothetical protein
MTSVICTVVSPIYQSSQGIHDIATDWQQIKVYCKPNQVNATDLGSLPLKYSTLYKYECGLFTMNCKPTARLPIINMYHQGWIVVQPFVAWLVHTYMLSE